MRSTIRSAGVGGLAASLVLALAPAAGAAPHTTVDTAAELRAALADAANPGGPREIQVDGRIELDQPAVYDGDRRLGLSGPGTLVGTDPEQDVLVVTTTRRVSLEDVAIEGGRRGLVVVVPDDATGRVRVDLTDVSVTGTGYHGVQLIDGVVDLAATGDGVGTGTAIPDATLPTAALVESAVVGGSAAGVVLRAEGLQVLDSGRGALDQDGLRIDERGDGDVVGRIAGSRFVGNGADGIELDEAGAGRVRAVVEETTITGNGDFDVDADPDDGFDVDEADDGDLVVRLEEVTISDNLDEGLDLDEEGNGDLVLRAELLTATGNVDENVKATELGDGDLRVRIVDSILSGSVDDDGIQLEELDAGIVRGAVRDSAITQNDSDGIDLLSLDVSEEEFEELDDADAPLPRDGATGLLRLRDVQLDANGDGPQDDVATFGVAVRGDRKIPAFPPQEPPAPEAAYTLTVLHVNDGESDLLASEADLDPGAGTISRFGQLLIDQRRALEPGRDAGVVAITAGDNFLASPEFEASLAKGVPFYDTIALDYLDFDAYTIGNHEFDFGPEVLADFVSGLDRCNDPFISANLDFSAEPSLQALVDEGCIQSSTVTIRDGRRIGIIGLTTPDLREVSSPGDVVIRDDLAQIANAQAAALTDQGVDIVLVASHLQDLDNEVALAGQLTGVDAIIGGGGGEDLTEARTATTADGVQIPIVTVPGDYFDLGRLTLQLTDDGQLVDFSWELLDVGSDLRQDRFLLRNVEEPVAEFVAQLDETVLTTSDVGLNGVRSEVRTRETNVGNLLSDSFVDVAEARAAEFGVTLDGPLVGLQNGGGIRNDSIIGPGEITLLDTFDIAPFTNFVSVLVDVAPADLVTALEHGFAGLPDPEGFFAQWSGLVVEYDATQPAGSRVVDLTVNETPYVVAGVLQDGLAPVDIATIDFLAAGNDGYDVFETYGFTRLGTSYQQSLAEILPTADLSTDSVEYQPREDPALRTRIVPTG